MNENKTYFQRVSTMLEGLLKQLKNEPPINYGTMIRNFFPVVIITLAPLLMALVFYRELSTVSVVLGCAVAPVLLVFGIVLKRRYGKETYGGNDTLNKITTLRQQVSAYENNYPDVQKYIQQFDAQVDETISQKKQIVKRFGTFKTCYMVLGAIITAYLFFVGITRSRDVVNERDTEDISYILQLERNHPYLTLAPLRTEIDGNHNVESQSIGIYLRGTKEIYLLTADLRISNAAPDDLFRMMITDTDGRPIAQSPKFVFLGEDINKIESDKVCYENGTYNPFEALQVLKYMQDHAQELRFVVEKIEQ